MAKNQTAVPEGAARERKSAGDAAAGNGRERVFPLEVLRANCTRLFGCTSSTFDGAFFGADGEQEYTVKEAGGLIEKWKGRGIGN